MTEQERLVEAQRQADALERIADELEFQNAVLAELARAQHMTAVSANEYSEPDERARSSPNTRSLLSMIRDQEHERDRDGGLLADGGGEPTREELEERVADLEQTVEQIAEHNRRDTAPEGRR